MMYGLTVDECRRVVELAGGDPAAVDAAIRVVLKQGQAGEAALGPGETLGEAHRRMREGARADERRLRHAGDGAKAPLTLNPSDMDALLDALNEDEARGADEGEA